METGRSFEEHWGALADDLRDALLGRRVPASLIDDVVQETGFRLLKMWSDVDFARSPRALAFTIARNLLYDELRKMRFQDATGDVPDGPSDIDVERAGLARLELARIARAIQQLCPSQRSALLAEIGAAEAPHRTPAAAKMLRMRARRRLNELLERASAGLFVFELRRSPGRFAGFLKRSAVPLEASAAFVGVCGSVAVIVAVTGGPRAEAKPKAVPSPLPLVASVAAADHAIGSRFGDAADHRPARASRRGAPRPASAPPAPSQHRPSVLFGDGDDPLQGGADVRSKDDEEDDGIQAPSCHVEPGDREVTVSCRIDTGDKEHEVTARVGARP